MLNKCVKCALFFIVVVVVVAFFLLAFEIEARKRKNRLKNNFLPKFFQSIKMNNKNNYFSKLKQCKI
jgi:hypothetical protein